MSRWQPLTMSTRAKCPTTPPQLTARHYPLVLLEAVLCWHSGPPLAGAKAERRHGDGGGGETWRLTTDEDLCDGSCGQLQMDSSAEFQQKNTYEAQQFFRQERMYPSTQELGKMYSSDDGGLKWGRGKINVSVGHIE